MFAGWIPQLGSCPYLFLRARVTRDVLYDNGQHGWGGHKRHKVAAPPGRSTRLYWGEEDWIELLQLMVQAKKERDYCLKGSRWKALKHITTDFTHCYPSVLESWF